MWETQVWSQARRILEKEMQPTPVFLPGEFQGQRSLWGLHSMGWPRVGPEWATNTFHFQVNIYPQVLVSGRWSPNEHPHQNSLGKAGSLYCWRVQGRCLQMGRPWTARPRDLATSDLQPPELSGINLTFLSCSAAVFCQSDRSWDSAEVFRTLVSTFAWSLMAMVLSAQAEKVGGFIPHNTGNRGVSTQERVTSRGVGSAVSRGEVTGWGQDQAWLLGRRGVGSRMQSAGTSLNTGGGWVLSQGGLAPRPRSEDYVPEGLLEPGLWMELPRKPMGMRMRTVSNEPLDTWRPDWYLPWSWAHRKILSHVPCQSILCNPVNYRGESSPPDSWANTLRMSGYCAWSHGASKNGLALPGTADGTRARC